jgi:hypothetical protein
MYFYGFSLGDGCITKNSRGTKYIYTLTLKYIDDCIMKNICKWIDLPETNIKYYNNRKTKVARLVLSGDIWQRDWSDFGLVPRKTHNPSILNVPNEFIKPFLIGFIDADGSIAFEKLRKGNRKENSIQLVGHPKNMDWIIDQFRKLGFNGNINSQMVKGKWKRIRIQRKNDVIELGKILEIDKYYSIALERKWKTLYDRIVQI